MTDLPLICTVVLTWNNFDDTDECLSSLVAQGYARHRIFLIDNGSDDGSSGQLVAKWGEEVDMIRLPVNLGCGGGYAEGIRHALDAGARYVAIIDNDMVAERSLLGELAAALAANPGAALMAPIMTYYDDPGRVWFARGTYNQTFGITRHVHMGTRVPDLPGLLGRVYETDYAPSCAVLIERQALQDVGLPDERFFFGHDDVDWCLRARARGYRSLVLGKALVRHKVSATGGVRGSTAFSDFSAYHHAKGSILLGAKHARGRALAPYLAGQLLVRWPYYSVEMVRAGRLTGPWSYLRGLAAGLRYLTPRSI